MVDYFQLGWIQLAWFGMQGKQKTKIIDIFYSIFLSSVRATTLLGHRYFIIKNI